MRNMLLEVGFANFDEAKDEITAFQHLHAKIIGLVCIGHDMPSMDGLALLRRIRSAPEFAHVPVLISILPSMRPEDVAAARGAGAEILMKWDCGSLANKLESILNPSK